MENTRQFKLIGEPVDIDWNVQGDEWLTRFTQALTEQDSGLGVTGYLHDETTRPCLEIRTCSLLDPSIEYKLLLARKDVAVLLLISADETEDIPSAVIIAWLEAARAATQSLGTQYPKHDWSAVIGPTPSRMSVVRAGVDTEGLAAPGSFGSLELSSCGRHVLEAVTNPEMPSFSGGHIHGSIPIIVHGSSQGYSWESAAVSAARDLNRACAILSVSWDVCMVVRESPAPLEWGVRQVPERPIGFPADFVPQVSVAPVVDRKIPPWAGVAWQIVDKKRRVSDAVAAFHEGFKVEATNPSLALVSFIASVEGISQLIFRDNKCDKCHAYRDIKVKFVETLRLVLSDRAADDLGRAYSSRSYTVHRGKLYGFESIAGSIRAEMWSQDDRRDFLHTRVYPMQQASREILLLALKDELPAKRTFVRESVE
jgi:hypothetical protein